MQAKSDALGRWRAAVRPVALGSRRRMALWATAAALCTVARDGDAWLQAVERAHGWADWREWLPDPRFDTDGRRTDTG